MIFFDSQQNALRKVIAATLLAFFVLSSLSGATESILCSSSENIHIFQQKYFSLAGCHGVPAAHPEHPAQQAILVDLDSHHDNPCVDVALGSSDSSIPTHNLKRVQPPKTPPLPLFSSQPRLALQSDPGTVPSTFQKYPLSSPLTVLRTIVLLV